VRFIRTQPGFLWVFTLAVNFLLACPRQDSNLPVTSSLRAGSLPCELRLVVRPTVVTWQTVARQLAHGRLPENTGSHRSVFERCSGVCGDGRIMILPAIIPLAGTCGAWCQ
jgi:hypothetical protein